jgi:hypothetical protein
MTSFDDVPICLSGGADGADLMWGMVAGSVGHQVYHFIFPGHRSKAPQSELVVLTPEMLAVADPFLERANKTLKRKWPVSNPWVGNLLRRNYYQIRDSESVYAVAAIGKDGLIVGGTSWATTMMIDLHGDNSRVYVFDQTLETWFSWQGLWIPIDRPPVPTGVWAGIGSRDLKQSGKEAIRNLLEYRSS